MKKITEKKKDKRETTDSVELSSDENSIINERRNKLKNLRDSGFSYPNKFVPHDRAKILIEKYSEKNRDFFGTTEIKVTVAGRIMLKRLQGKSSFFTLQDTSDRIQLYIKEDLIGVDEHKKIKLFDLGDYIYSVGILFKTQKGELSIRCTKISLLAKSIRPLPDKFHGLQDREIRVRKRHLDLIVNNDTRKIFEIRSKTVSYLRNFMEDNNFLEVETPMLHPIPGGATAKPFKTHHNSLNQEMYLRIAPELYLKRLIVGGFERVFEINRSFRNEGISTRHNPEFTMMEFYSAYTDYKWLMFFVEKMFKELIKFVLGKKKFVFQEHEIDLSKKFARMTIKEAVCNVLDEYDENSLDDPKLLKQLIVKYDSTQNFSNIKNFTPVVLQYKLFESIAEESLIQPTFIIDHPTEVSPLAKSSEKDKNITERFELYIAGKEIANGFSELNDPEEQSVRFNNQVKSKEAGDQEAMHYDNDYIEALEVGMPPTGGCGIGIDRLLMLLVNKPSIRDVIFFPALRRLN